MDACLAPKLPISSCVNQAMATVPDYWSEGDLSTFNANIVISLRSTSPGLVVHRDRQHAQQGRKVLSARSRRSWAATSHRSGRRGSIPRVSPVSLHMWHYAVGSGLGYP